MADACRPCTSSLRKASSSPPRRTHQPSGPRSSCLVGGVLVNLQSYPRHHIAFAGFYGLRLHKHHGSDDEEEIDLLSWQLLHVRQNQARERGEPDEGLSQATRRDRAYKKVRILFQRHGIRPFIFARRFIASAGTYANLVRQAKSKQKIIDKMEAAGLIEKVETPKPLRYEALLSLDLEGI